jgi:hypothetical protein
MSGQLAALEKTRRQSPPSCCRTSAPQSSLLLRSE